MFLIALLLVRVFLACVFLLYFPIAAGRVKKYICFKNWNKNLKLFQTKHLKKKKTQLCISNTNVKKCFHSGNESTRSNQQRD